MEFAGRSLLVTGGAGFVGSHLCEALVARGARVTVADDLSNGTAENLRAVAGSVRFEQLDARQPALGELAVAGGFDAVVHLAASAYVPTSVNDPSYDFGVNLAAPFQLLEALRRAGSAPALVVASSAAVYGSPSRVPMTETDPTVPISPYGVSKLAVERYVAVFSQLYGLRSASLRFFSAYGPRQTKQIVYDFIAKLARDPAEMTIIGDGTQVRDLVYVEDVVQAILVTLRSAPLRGEVYNVATGRGYTTREIAETTARAMGLSPRFRYTGETRPGDAERWIACVDRIGQLGFAPRFSLEEGIGRTVEWYNARR